METDKFIAKLHMNLEPIFILFFLGPQEKCTKYTCMPTANHKNYVLSCKKRKHRWKCHRLTSWSKKLSFIHNFIRFKQRIHKPTCLQVDSIIFVVENGKRRMHTKCAHFCLLFDTFVLNSNAMIIVFLRTHTRTHPSHRITFFHTSFGVCLCLYTRIHSRSAHFWA